MEPAKKRRKIVEESDEEGITPVPIEPKPTGNGKTLSNTASASAKVANEPTAEESPSDNDSDPMGEDEPDLDPQAEKKVAEKLYVQRSRRKLI